MTEEGKDENEDGNKLLLFFVQQFNDIQNEQNTINEDVLQDRLFNVSNNNIHDVAISFNKRKSPNYS